MRPRVWMRGSLDVQVGGSELFAIRWHSFGFALARHAQSWAIYATGMRTVGLVLGRVSFRVWLGALDRGYFVLRRNPKRFHRLLWVSNADVWPDIIECN